VNRFAVSSIRYQSQSAPICSPIGNGSHSQNVSSLGIRAMAPTLLALRSRRGPTPGNDGLLRRDHADDHFKTFAIYAGAVICFGGLIFAGIRMMSGRSRRHPRTLWRALRSWSPRLGCGWIGSPPADDAVGGGHDKRGEPLQSSGAQ